MDPIEESLYKKYNVNPATHRLDKERGEFVPITDPANTQPGLVPDKPTQVDKMLSPAHEAVGFGQDIAGVAAETMRRAQDINNLKTLDPKAPAVFNPNMPQPRYEGPGMTVARRTAGSLLPTLGSLPLMLKGAQVGGRIPGPPLVKGIGGLVGGLGAGMGGQIALDKAQTWVARKLAPALQKANEEQLAINAEANPISDVVGGLLPMAAGMKVQPKMVGQAIRGLGQVLRDEATKAAMLNVGLNTGLGVGMQAMSDFDKDKPLYGQSVGKLGASALGNMALGGPRSLVAKAARGLGVKPHAAETPELMTQARQAAETKSPTVDPVPTSRESVVEQIKDMLNPASSRKVVLITPGESYAGLALPSNVKIGKSPQGEVLYTDSKPVDLTQLPAEGDFPGDLLGMSQRVKPVETDTVVSTTRDGVEVLTEVVPDTAEAIAKAKAAHAKAVPGGQSIATKAGQVIDERLMAGNKGSSVNPGQNLDDLPLFREGLNNNEPKPKTPRQPILLPPSTLPPKPAPKPYIPENPELGADIPAAEQQTIVPEPVAGVHEVDPNTGMTPKEAFEAYGDQTTQTRVPGDLAEAQRYQNMKLRQAQAERDTLRKQRAEQDRVAMEAQAEELRRVQEEVRLLRAQADGTNRERDFLLGRQEAALAKTPSPVTARKAGPVSTPVQDRIAAAREAGVTGELTEQGVAKGPIKEKLPADLTDPLSEAEMVQDEYDTGKRYQPAVEDKPKITKAWNDFWKKTALSKYLVTTKEKAGIKTPLGTQARGSMDPTTREMEIDLGRATQDTQPHEIFHQVTADIKARGTKAERAFIERAEAQLGGEEFLAQAVGESFVGRLDKRQDRIVQDMLSFIKYKLGRATNKDLARIGSNIIARGRGGREMGFGDMVGQAKPVGGTKYQTEEEVGGPKELDERKAPRPKFDSAVNALERAKDPELNQIGKAIKTAFYNRREYLGEYERPVIEALDKLSDNELKAFNDYVIKSEATEDLTPIEGSSALSNAVQSYRDMYKAIGQERIKLGMKVTDRKGRERDGGLDPTGMPHLIDPDVRQVLKTQQGTPEWNKLRDEFTAHNTALKVDPEVIDATFKKYAGATPSKNDQANDPFFQALRRSELTKLPASWIDKNPKRWWEKYVQRVAGDMAMFKNVESVPGLAELAGVKDNTLNPGVNSMGGHPLVIEAMEAFNPTIQESRTLSKVAQTGANLATLGIVANPVTRTKDFLGVLPRSLGLISPLRIPETLAGSFVNLAGAKSRAKSSGFIRPMANYIDNVVGITDRTDKYLRTFMRGYSKATLSESIENASRVLAQSAGEAVINTQLAVIENATKANKGFMDDIGVKSAQRFMDNLGTDWKQLAKTPEGRAKLGSRVGLIVQGTYDGSNLPDWAMKGAGKPLMSLARWSIEQQNNFKKYQLDPLFKDGDAGPLISHLVMTMLGGWATKEVADLLAGRKSFMPTFKEIENAPDKKRANEAMAGKLGNYAQMASTFGFMGDMALANLQAAGGQPINEVGSPIVNVFNDTVRHVRGALQGWSDGEDFGKVFTKLVSELSTGHVSMARLARNWWDKSGVTEAGKERATAKDARRDYSVFKRLNGETIRPFAPIAGYHNISEKEFDLAPIGESVGLVSERMGEMLQGNIEDVPKKLRSLRSLGNTGESPSVTRDMPGFMKYVEFVRKTQGNEAANKLMNRSVTKEMERGIKRQMIPSVSGR